MILNPQPPHTNIDCWGTKAPGGSDCPKCTADIPNVIKAPPRAVIGVSVKESASSGGAGGSASHVGQMLPTESKDRKALPLCRGVLDYFPAALAAVAGLSQAGNDKHNPGQELHHARGKSSDHADCILRHLVDRGAIDPEDGILHDVKVAWRALAMLQEELERRGAPKARGAK